MCSPGTYTPSNSRLPIACGREQRLVLAAQAVGAPGDRERGDRACRRRCARTPCRCRPRARWRSTASRRSAGSRRRRPARPRARARTRPSRRRARSARTPATALPSATRGIHSSLSSVAAGLEDRVRAESLDRERGLGLGALARERLADQAQLDRADRPVLEQPRQQSVLGERLDQRAVDAAGVAGRRRSASSVVARELAGCAS